MVTNFAKKSSVVWRWMAACMIAAAFAAPMGAAAQTTFSKIVVFGDSLSDPGNDFALINTQNTPPYDGLDPLTIIPHAPYAKGGHHFSNGATWVEQFAKRRGLAQYVAPAWLSSGTKAANYAVGGGRAYDDNVQVNLPDQVRQYLTDAGGQATSDTLYVLEFGGNDIRDILTTGDFSLISVGLMSIKDNILALYGSGATTFLVWNVPDLSLTPAIIALDRLQPGTQEGVRQLVDIYNAGIEAVLAALSGLPGVEIKRFDAAAAVRALVGDPGANGLEVVNTACVTPKVPPFDCKEPDEYLFWDGIHPTNAVHGIFAQEVADLLAQ